MKKVVIAVTIAILWVGCGYINYGLTMGEFTHSYPWDNHEGFAGEMAILGIAALPTTFLGGLPIHHWLTKPYTTEQRWEAFHKRWPNLDREYFEQEYN